MKLAVQFGAGNIGRGFMGQLFWEAGYRIIFVEANEELVDLLNRRGAYPLRLLDAYSRKEIDMTIDRFEAISPKKGEEIAKLVSRADVISTAVGVKSLVHVAPLLARGIEKRFKNKSGTVDILLCENSLSAAEILKGEVMRNIDSRVKSWLEKNIGFVGTAVVRMVPASSKRFGVDDPLFVVADSHHKLSYDGRALRAKAPMIEGLKGVKNFKAEMMRKLFTHNLGHAALAYLGKLKGYTYVHEPFDDAELDLIFDSALDETTASLIKMYPDDIDMEEHKEVRRDIKVRFGNPMIMDTIKRVGKDPIRKLGYEERLIGSAELCISQGIFPEKIAYICGAAFCYDDPDDPESVRLQEKIRKNGIEETLKEISQVEPQSKLGKKIIGFYYELVEKRKERKG